MEPHLTGSIFMTFLSEFGDGRFSPAPRCFPTVLRAFYERHTRCAVGFLFLTRELLLPRPIRAPELIRFVHQLQAGSVRVKDQRTDLLTVRAQQVSGIRVHLLRGDRCLAAIVTLRRLALPSTMDAEPTDRLVGPRMNPHFTPFQRVVGTVDDYR